MISHKRKAAPTKPIRLSLLTPWLLMSAVILALALALPNAADGQPDDAPAPPPEEPEDTPDAGPTDDADADPGVEPEPPQEPAQPTEEQPEGETAVGEAAGGDTADGDATDGDTTDEDATDEDATDGSSGSQVHNTGSKGHKPVVPESAAVGGRYILRSGDMSLRSFTPQETRDQVNELMETLGGYVQSSRGDRFSYRIPSDRLDEAVEGLRQIGEVVDENLRSEDVTMEVATLSAQIAETEESRQRIMAMLEQTNAVSENLAIEDELRTVTQELESHQGRARYLNKRLQMSPLEVVVSMKVRPKVEEPRKSQPFPWVEGYGLSGLLD